MSLPPFGTSSLCACSCPRWHPGACRCNSFSDVEGEKKGVRQRAWAAQRITRLRCDAGSSFPELFSYFLFPPSFFLYLALCEYPDYADRLMRVRGSFSARIQITATIVRLQQSARRSVLLNFSLYTERERGGGLVMEEGPPPPKKNPQHSPDI